MATKNAKATKGGKCYCQKGFMGKAIAFAKNFNGKPFKVGDKVYCSLTDETGIVNKILLRKYSCWKCHEPYSFWEICTKVPGGVSEGIFAPGEFRKVTK